MADQPKFPKAVVQLVGEDGNALAIMGRTIRALKRAGANPAEIEQFTKEATAGDYDHVLTTVMQWVTTDE